MTEPESHARADAALPKPFTAAMNAATSRFGVLCDIPITFIVVAAIGTVTAGAYSLASGIPVWIAAVVVPVPVFVCIIANLVLRNARRDVVAWLGAVPFPIENVNAVLCGAGEYFEVFFSDDPPPREVVMEFFELASDEVFELERDETRRVVSARFGVMDSKRNPYRSANRRYERMRLVVARALVPLHGRHPIARVLIV